MNTSANTFYCAACDSPVPGFFTYGMKSWGCPRCGASPRERYVNFCLNEKLLEVPSGARILHMAPSEKSLTKRFSKAGEVTFGDICPENYPSLNVARVDLMEMENLGTFDLFYASHVMEHVPDDDVVFRNLKAHLEPGGEAWLLVPLHDNPTIDGHENMSVKGKERNFGQWDHVRQYGIDILDRLSDAGFECKLLEATSTVPDIFYRYGLSIEDKIFVARPAAGPAR